MSPKTEGTRRCRGRRAGDFRRIRFHGVLNVLQDPPVIEVIKVQEVWDVLDASGRKTGRTMLRGEPIAPGDYHLVVHIWIRNEKKEYLIQKRAEHLDLFPGLWATTGGSVVAGEDSLSGAIRETREEVGLTLQKSWLSLLSRIVREGSIVDVWFAQVQSADLEQPVLNEEVSAIRWVSKDTIRQMIRSGEFHDYGYIDRLLP